MPVFGPAESTSHDNVVQVSVMLVSMSQPCLIVNTELYRASGVCTFEVNTLHAAAMSSSARLEPDVLDLDRFVIGQITTTRATRPLGIDPSTCRKSRCASTQTIAISIVKSFASELPCL